MRILFLGGLLLVNIFVFAQDSEIKQWNDLDKLNWDDFKGTVDPDVFAYAQTSYKIDILPETVQVDEHDNIRNYKSLTVVANFYLQSSWNTIEDRSLLIHEQLHFDIAELFARKIRKRFLELQNNKERNFSVYQKEYSLLWTELRKYQQKYDKETNHGVNISKNKEWSKDILSQIKSLATYKM